MDSYSQPPAFTPGWNDPPVLSHPNNNNTVKSSLLLHRNRRPVDPSIQLGALQQSNEVNSSFPRTASYSGFTAMHNQTITPPQPHMHGAHSSPNIVQQNHQNPMYPVPSPNQMTQPSFEPSVHPTSFPNTVYDVFTIPPPANSYPVQPVSSPSLQPGQVMYASANHNGHAHDHYQQNSDSYGAKMNDASAYMQPQPIRPNVDTDPSALIFSPPNAINHEQQRPSTQPDPSRYVPPIKAPGDVSLNGPQLIAFLTKASLRLPQGATRDGIQLRIGQLNGLVQSAQISENLIKSLNYVVDAIDRGIYDEAWTFFEHMQTQCPGEISGWSQGIRLLIGELKKSNTTRAQSAGTRYM